MEVRIIAAMDYVRGIGRDGGVPWRYSQHMSRFKSLTVGHAVIMGRRTWESLKAPLVGRTNIVVSRATVTGAHQVPSFDDAVDLALDHHELAWAIGGSRIYEDAMQVASRMEITVVPGTYDCDVFFPPIGVEWERRKSRLVNGSGLMFYSYERRE